jgi:ABC-type Na+ transport system ATPase subunit NatA
VGARTERGGEVHAAPALCDRDLADLRGHPHLRDGRPIRASGDPRADGADRTRLYGDATPREHLGLVARLHGLTAADVDRALGSFDLLGPSRRRNRALSSGQRQRVALARAALRRPDLLLLDEPYGSLDVTNRDAVDALVADAQARGATVLLATHDVERAALVADRVVDLAAGRVVGDARNAPVAAIPIREFVG